MTGDERKWRRAGGQKRGWGERFEDGKSKKKSLTTTTSDRVNHHVERPFVEAVDRREGFVSDDVGRARAAAQRVAVDDRHWDLSDDPEVSTCRRRRRRSEVLCELEAEVPDAFVSVENEDLVARARNRTSS